MGCGMVGFFFLESWKATRERLLGLFAASFWLLGFERIIPLFVEEKEGTTGQYLVRLIAFLLILYAIVDKNLRHSKPRG